MRQHVETAQPDNAVAPAQVLRSSQLLFKIAVFHSTDSAPVLVVVTHSATVNSAYSAASDTPDVAALVRATFNSAGSAASVDSAVHSAASDSDSDTIAFDSVSASDDCQ